MCDIFLLLTARNAVLVTCSYPTAIVEGINILMKTAIVFIIISGAVDASHSRADFEGVSK